MPEDMYARALARLDTLRKTLEGLDLLRAALELEQARHTTLGHEEDAAAARFRTALREFAGYSGSAKPCDDCGGTGLVPGFDDPWADVRCGHCGGKGMIP